MVMMRDVQRLNAHLGREVSLLTCALFVRAEYALCWTTNAASYAAAAE